MKDHDPILESALDEALGGKAPPDLIASTLARVNAPQPDAGQSVAGPRPPWRAWGTGLAAAAMVVISAAVTLELVSGRTAPPDTQATVVQHELGDAVGTGKEKTVGSDSRVNFNTASREPIPSSQLQTLTPRADTARPAYPPSVTAKSVGANPFVDTEDDPLSTFALEHDTGSYTLARGMLNGGNLPPAEAIRPEEFINYFDYGYLKPSRDAFEITMDAAPSRYGADIRNCVLLRICVQAREVHPVQRKAAMLTFVVDTSGSMAGENRLGLLKQGLKLLVEQLNAEDSVAIVGYGSEAFVALEPVSGADKAAINAAIDSLSANGSTNAEDGLRLGYRLASQRFTAGATNRVILCSDGVANVGATGPDAILNTIVENRRNGITLSAIGVGMGNYNDHLLEQLGDKGDGHYAYVDSLEEARRVFADNLTGALEVVGRDVKIQVAFNPAVVKSYRLIGYANRDVKDADFRNDAVDGGEIGSGHAATALFEIKLHDDAQGEIARATVRYRTDEEGKFTEITHDYFTAQIATAWEQAEPGLRLAANAAELAEILGEVFYAKHAKLDPIIEDLETINPSLRNDKAIELLQLAMRARELKK